MSAMPSVVTGSGPLRCPRDRTTEATHAGETLLVGIATVAVVVAGFAAIARG